MKLAWAQLLPAAALAQTPAKQKPAAVEGKVINSLNGEAIRKAELTIATDLIPEGFSEMAAKLGLDTGAPAGTIFLSANAPDSSYTAR
jgi:hypothetical protein